ncbi:hypothetical protein B566_EDAN010676 [Ephemera danica]|nr:hypothetical protein B566_EDAN010676 [Ephemera danica]
MEHSPAASEEHLKLATFIKNVHQQLRQQSEKLGFEKAWEMHCSQLEMLKQYSSSMANLATEHWSLNNSEAMCRINWIQLKCIDYFFQSGKVKHRELEEHKLSLFGYKEQFSEKLNMEPQCVSGSNVLDLLDVGSCYNPFEKFPIFKVLAVDIAPGHPSVKKCDFLTVKLVSQYTDCVHSRDNTLEQISKNSFDIVIFSLLLEYFPNSESRFKCCSNAYEVLKPEGLLFIITPDSKHATANSKIMKKWRLALATLGFWRIHYEKLKHLHCMAFCKSKYHLFPKLWVEREASKCEMQEEIKSPSSLMMIPQDLNSSRNMNEDTELPEERNIEDLVDLFQELPTFDSDTN